MRAAEKGCEKGCEKGRRERETTSSQIEKGLRQKRSIISIISHAILYSSIMKQSHLCILIILTKKTSVLLDLLLTMLYALDLHDDKTTTLPFVRPP